jgi:hypothetical protein
LFAVVSEAEEGRPLLNVYDSKGELKAEGRGVIKRLEARVSAEDRQAGSLRLSRLAWSPDGNWISCVANGRLVLWNWRNDETRIHAPPVSVEE